MHVYILLLAHSTPLYSSPSPLRSTVRVTWATISEMWPDCAGSTSVAVRQRRCKKPRCDWQLCDGKKKTRLKAAAYEGNEPLVYWPIRLSAYLFSSAERIQFSDGAKWQSWPGGKTRTTPLLSRAEIQLLFSRLHTGSRRLTTTS